MAGHFANALAGQQHVATSSGSDFVCISVVVLQARVAKIMIGKIARTIAVTAVGQAVKPLACRCASRLCLGVNRFHPVRTASFKRPAVVGAGRSYFCKSL